jgi:hypothetical protein
MQRSLKALSKVDIYQPKQATLLVIKRWDGAPSWSLLTLTITRRIDSYSVKISGFLSHDIIVSCKLSSGDMEREKSISIYHEIIG